MAKEQVFNAIFQPEPEGGFTVIVPSLPGCVTYGETIAEAKEMAVEAIQGYIESLEKHDEPIPDDVPVLLSSVFVPVNVRTSSARLRSRAKAKAYAA